MVICLVWDTTVNSYLKAGNTHMPGNLIPFKHILLHIEKYMKHIEDCVWLWYVGKTSQK
jgi:hypothetical protein